MSPVRHRLRELGRLSLATRLGLGFGVIAVVLLAGHAAAQRDMRAVIATLRQTQTAQVPLSRAADALTDRALAFDRAVLAEVRLPTEESRASVTAAEAALFSSLDSYAELRPGASRDIDRLRSRAEEHTRLGWALIDLSAGRQAALNAIREGLDQLTRRISRAFGLNAKIPDPALARRAYADLELELGRLRSAFNNYLISGSAVTAAALRAATRSLRATVAEYRDELRRVPGKAWVELVEEDLGQVERRRQEVLRHDASIDELREQFTVSGLQLPVQLDQALAAPASRAVARSAGSAVDATRSAETAIGRLTYLVLAATLLVSLLSTLAVTRPVRRLKIATRALAHGAHQVRVPPCGSRELDELGTAFNQMARQLAEADREVQRHQRDLERRVRFRTRKLAHLANHDPLTDLPNRRYAFNHLRRVVRTAADNGRGTGLIALDVDNFKVINDTFGHDVGDALLRGVVERLKVLAGERRFIARLGGDEFVISLEDENPARAALAMAESIVNGFRTPLDVGGREVQVSVSIGVAHFPEHAGDSADLVRAADAALFRAKALGRNRVAVFSHALLEDSEERFALEQALRRAVEARELTLAYQPQVSLIDGSTRVVEALLRWQKEDGSLVPAGRFLPVAEQSGLIIEIGEWALENAAVAVADWRTRGFEDARVAVNVSVHQLLDSRFVDRVSETLSRHGLPAEAIELELTETAFQTSAATIQALRQVREGGIGLALDDFGSGYSSLTSLSRLPLRRVKIDRSLVADIPSSQRAESLARSIIGVCQSLDLDVTVEGIERAEQLAWLSGCGPVHAQGFLVGRPMTADYVPRFARHSAERLQKLRAGAPPEIFDDDTDGRIVAFRSGSAATEG